MSSRLVGTRRPRLLPRALLASGLVVAVACTAVAATAGPARQGAQTCPANQEWVTIVPAVDDVQGWVIHQWDVSERRPLRPAAPLAGCLDTRDLPSPPDSRG